jgi:hypothetical protein
MLTEENFNFQIQGISKQIKQFLTIITDIQRSIDSKLDKICNTVQNLNNENV